MYEIKNTFGETGPKFTFRSNYDVDGKTKGKRHPKAPPIPDIPGPGAYDLPDNVKGPSYSIPPIHSTTKKIITKNESTKSYEKLPEKNYWDVSGTKFGTQPREGLIDKFTTKTPGPYSYNLNGMSTSSPKWTFSTTERLLKRKLTKSKIIENKKKQRTQTPGPSAVRSFFGKEGPSFSFSRVIYNHSDPLDEYAKKHYNVPDPGHYQKNLTYRPDTPSYTISNSLRPNDKKVKEKDTLLGPGHYKINYSSSSKNKKLPDWSFGKTTREDYDDNKQYDKNNKPKPQNPGPGFYTYKNDLFPQGPRYTIAVLPKEAKIEVKPGPGQYNPNFNDKQSEPVYTIGRGVRPDIIKDNKKQNFPGPGFYKIQDVYLAKNVTFPKAGLINSENISKNKKKYKKFEVPGPGFYKIPTAYDYINDYTREKGAWDPTFRYV